MTYTNSWSTTYPDGATTDAADIDTAIQRAFVDVGERMADLFGVTMTTDPLVPTKVGNAITIASSQVKATFYDAGNSSTAITINWNNGINQKVTMTGNCTFTFSNPVSGTDYSLYLVQDGTGGRSTTLPATVRWTNNASAPTLDTTAARTTRICFFYDGSKYIAGLYGTGFNVS